LSRNDQTPQHSDFEKDVDPCILQVSNNCEKEETKARSLQVRENLQKCILSPESERKTGKKGEGLKFLGCTEGVAGGRN